ncbi:DUF2273 domain-containing protein [Metallumcola ferriviriculae]|uniref:DUF2273 domain-containing protein n=1 Tax=Metallumcola ferriviriculae TaxID=3039180 RepID=A0AAU0UQ79_9FIRM|nr:DUF2273 domain-containing protein [Desulfitibacteraceae bacterium MK1]
MDWYEIIAELWNNHRGKFLGIIIGLTFGLLTALVGFWQTLFISICIVIGYLIGKRMDENESFREILERILK